MGDRVRDAVRDGIGGGHRRRHDVLNQAAASAVPVVTLPRHGTGAERALDVLVGDGVALILGVTGGSGELRSEVVDAARAVTGLPETAAQGHSSALTVVVSAIAKDLEGVIRNRT